MAEPPGLAPACVRWAALVARAEEERDTAVARLAAALAGAGCCDGRVMIEEETVTRVGREEGVLRTSRLRVCGRLPVGARSQLGDLGRRAREVVVDVDLEDLHCELSLGERAPLVDGLLTSEGEPQALFSLPRKGFPMVVLFHEARSGSGLEAMMRLNSLLRGLRGTDTVRRPHPLASKQHQPRVSGVAVSVDRSMSDFSAMPHGGAELSHLWVGDKGWDAPAVQAFGVRSVPYCFVLDRQRVVVWSGHPGADFASLEGVLRGLFRAGTGASANITSGSDDNSRSRNSNNNDKNDDSANTPLSHARWGALPMEEQNRLFQSVRATLAETPGLERVSLLAETTRRWHIDSNGAATTHAQSDTEFRVDGCAPAHCRDELDSLRESLVQVIEPANARGRQDDDLAGDSFHFCVDVIDA
jgi:hypothetical protein